MLTVQDDAQKEKMSVILSKWSSVMGAKNLHVCGLSATSSPKFLFLNVQPSAYVYILTNKTKTTLYVGVTTDLPTRLWQHREKQSPSSFTARYNLSILVYYEGYMWIGHAIKREKYIKGKTRKWKEELIRSKNPVWRDLTDDLLR